MRAIQGNKGVFVRVFIKTKSCEGHLRLTGSLVLKPYSLSQRVVGAAIVVSRQSGLGIGKHAENKPSVLSEVWSTVLKPFRTVELLGGNDGCGANSIVTLCCWCVDCANC